MYPVISESFIKGLFYKGFIENDHFIFMPCGHLLGKG